MESHRSRRMAELIKRGDYWIVDLEPGFAREIHKRRPGLIISGNRFNEVASYVIIIPTTSIVPKVLSEEMVYLGKPKGFDQESTLLPFYIRSIDRDRLIKKVGKISKQKLMEAEEKIKIVLELNQEE